MTYRADVDPADLVEIANEGSRELGFADTGALWRSGYDMPADDFAAETDRLWHAIISTGGQESACGWCKDRWGISWQITPRALSAAMADPDPAAAQRVFAAMMAMTKIDIAAIEAARRGP